MDSLSDLMDDGDGPKPPRRDLDNSDFSDDSAATPGDTAANKKLARHLRALSLKVRSDLLAELKKTNPNPARVEDLFASLIGYVHRGSADEFWPLVDGLYRLGIPSILRGAIVMGGWHRQLPQMLDETTTKLPEKLEDVLGLVAICQQALAVVQRLPRPTWKEHLVTHKWLFPFADDLDPWLPDAAMEQVKAVRHDLNRKAEHILCTMQNQALVFYPTPDVPRRGWEDFHTILSWYRLLDFSVLRDFGPCYFLFQPPD